MLALVRTQLELLELGLAAEALAAADLVPASSTASGPKKRSAGVDLELETDFVETGTVISDQQLCDKLNNYLAKLRGKGKWNVVGLGGSAAI